MVSSGSGASSDSASLPKAYFDTCVISGLVEEDLKAEDQIALLDLMSFVEDSRLTICTSTEARGELAAVSPPERRDRHLEAYEAIRTLTKEDADWLDPEEPFTEEAQQVLERLRQVLPNEPDARHLAHAAMHGVHDFGTADRRTILNHRSQIEEVSGVAVWSPQEYRFCIAPETGSS